MDRIVIFCAASSKIDPKYNEAARELARGLHSKGYGLVSGGGKVGTMGAITDESVKCGGDHTAVLPKFMAGLENPGVTRVIWTDTMARRKEKMREGTVAAIALPGGIGTLDEVIETLTLAKLGRYPGKVVAFNFEGFYEPLKALLDHYVETGMLDRPSRRLISFPETLDDFLTCVQ